MKRFLAAMFVLFSVLSCGKNGTDGVYISVRNTSWEIRADNQVAWPSFIGSDQAAIVMYTSEYNAFQILNGSYTVDGHRVSVAAESTVTMVRTFSHLKNSSNKNYHVSSTCSNLKNARQGTLKEALLAGKTACSTCCPMAVSLPRLSALASMAWGMS